MTAGRRVAAGDREGGRLTAAGYERSIVDDDTVHRRALDARQMEVIGESLLIGAGRLALPALPSHRDALPLGKYRGGQIRTADSLVPNQVPYRWATPRW